MRKKMLPLICIFFLCMILARTGKAEALNTSTAKVEVIFENGLNEIVKTAGDNFVVSIKLTLPAGVVIDYWDMEIHWNTAALSLQNGIVSDVVEGPFMSAFGTTDYGLQSPDNAAGILPDISCGFLTGGDASGSGILCTIKFHCIVPGDGLITIYLPNEESYLLDQVGPDYEVVLIDPAVAGNVVPEFPAFLLLPLFLVATTVAIITVAVRSRKQRIPINIP